MRRRDPGPTSRDDDSPPSRRALLRLGGGALLGGLAGCAGAPAGGTASEPSEAPAAPTRTPPGTRTPASPDRTTLESNEPYRTAAGWTVRVAVFRVRRGVVAAAPDGGRPVIPRDRQFLQVGVETSGPDAPAPVDLCLAATVDGERPVEGCPARLDAAGEAGSLQALPVPLSFETAPGSAAVVWDRPDAPAVRWTVGDRTVDALARPPEFVVEGLDAPDAVPPGEEFEVGITVHNAGGRRDWFVAELGLASAAEGEALELAYGAGERLTKPRSLVADFGGSDELVVRLDWGLGASEATVARG